MTTRNSELPSVARGNRAVPLQTCPACGSTWFREVVLLPYAPVSGRGVESGLAPSGLAIMPMTILVCLCGRPIRPNVGGLRGGRTPNLAIVGFYESLDRTQSRIIMESQNIPSILRDSGDSFVPPEELASLKERVRHLERQIGLKIRDASHRSTRRGRIWQTTEREGETNGADRIVADLQRRGFTYETARELVRSVLAVIIDSLRRGESVETPLGIFEVVQNPKPRTCWRLRGFRRLYTRRKRVRFRPSPALTLELCADFVGGDQKMLTENGVPPQGCCPRCGSNHLQKVEYQQYQANMYSSVPGGELHAVSRYPFQALLCPCGEVILDRARLRSPWFSGFPESFQKAKASREAREFETICRQMQREFASRSDLEALEKRLKELEAILQRL